MSFTSLSFFIFFPITFALYWMLPSKRRWVLLLISSYIFYVSWNIEYSLLIIAITLVSYLAGIAIGKAPSPRLQKLILILSCIISFGILFVFKYFNWFFAMLNQVLHTLRLPKHSISLSLLLPVGISFFTFQSISYVVDVYRKNIAPQQHLGIYATYVAFFPQLVAGPIERTSDLLPQISSPKPFDYTNAVAGSKQILWGYFKKTVIADFAAIYADQVFADVHSYTGITLLIATLLFTIQIYCDFSGYSDIAIGSAKLLNITLTKNFNAPYFSASVKEFWSRWHISLSTWFKDYVYIPLGGNRRSKLRTYYNLLVTFAASGLWHGAHITFLVWGLLNGFAQILETMLGKYLSAARKVPLQKTLLTLLCFLFCNVSWVFFRAHSVQDALYVLTHYFEGISNLGTYLHVPLEVDPVSLVIFIASTVLLSARDYLQYHQKTIIFNKHLSHIFYVILTVVVILFSQKGGTAEFVYFQF